MDGRVKVCQPNCPGKLIYFPDQNKERHNPPMGKKARGGLTQCLFCETKRLTREHVWPDWICEMYKGRLYTHEIENRPHRRRYVKLQNSLTKTFACVCAKCNNVWMNKIELRA